MVGFKIASDNTVGHKVRALLTDISTLNVSCFGYELECLKYAAQLWIETLKCIKETECEIYQHDGNTQHTERMKQILSYIHNHYNEKIAVGDIAKYVNISRSECFRSFKRFMNRRPVEYINEYRLSIATKYLRETEISITDIYTKCGFENASYFGKIFKSVYGITPLQYRKLTVSA